MPEKKDTADPGTKWRCWEELRLNDTMKRKGEAESHCHGQELRGRAPQNQEKYLKPSLDEAAGLSAYTIVLIEQ